jgi:hypothetical protein
VNPTLADVDQARAHLDADLDRLITCVRMSMRAGDDPTACATAVAQECTAAAMADPMQLMRFLCVLGCAVVREAQRLEAS